MVCDNESDVDEVSRLIEDECKLKGFSSKTAKNYVFYVRGYFESGLSPKEFLLNMINKGKSKSTVRLAASAIKFYLRVLNNDSKQIDNIIKEVPLQKKEKKLPVVLSKEDIQDLISSTNNLTHRLIIVAGYSAGLRVSEVINLKWADVDFNRDVLHIKGAKGKKDRLVILSKIFKQYLLDYSNQKTGFIFKTNRGEKYTCRSVQSIIKHAANRINLKQNVSPHTLRHSFATHLLENGTDVRYIKDLLGHKDINTTLIYTQVSNKNLLNIKSPLD